jgi:general stress protein 26
MDTTDSSLRSLDDLLEPGSTLMVGTTSGTGQEWQFRPLTVARVTGAQIDILLDTNEEWVTEFSDGEPVHATLSDNRSNDWSHLQGTATISRDEALIDELWNPFAGAYFEDGRDTPGIAVLRITVESGRYWSTPSGRIGSLISMVSAALGGSRASGERGDVTP